MAATGQGTGTGQAAGGADAGQQQGQANGNGQGVQQAGGFEQQAHQQLQALGADDGDLRGFLNELGQQQQQFTQQAIQEALRAQQEAAQQAQQQQAPTPNFDLDAMGLATGDPSLDGQMQQQLTQAFEQYADAREQRLMDQLEERFGSLTNEVNGFKHEQALQDLAYKYPELQDAEAAQAVMGGQQTYVAARFGDLGQDVMQKLAQHPGMTELMYLALRAQQAHQQEEQQGSGDPGAATLEGGSGATPGGGQQGDAFDRMLAQKQGSSVLPWP